VGHMYIVVSLSSDVDSFRESQQLVVVLALFLSVGKVQHEAKGLFFYKLPFSTYPLSYIVGVTSSQ
jgi:hypothetical protein